MAKNKIKTLQIKRYHKTNKLEFPGNHVFIFRESETGFPGKLPIDNPNYNAYQKSVGEVMNDVH